MPPKPSSGSAVDATLAGYSGTPLVKKLGIGPQAKVVVLDEPAGYEDLLGELPAGVSLVAELGGAATLAHVFATERKALQRHLKAARVRLGDAVPVWVSWPKKASRVRTDITEDTIRELALPLGYVDIKVCAVSQTWSGLKLVVRKELRVKGAASRSAARASEP